MTSENWKEVITIKLRQLEGGQGSKIHVGLIFIFWNIHVLFVCNISQILLIFSKMQFSLDSHFCAREAFGILSKKLEQILYFLFGAFWNVPNLPKSGNILDSKIKISKTDSVTSDIPPRLLWSKNEHQTHLI